MLLSQRLIAQIQQASRRARNLTITHSEIDATDKDATAPDLENDCVFAGWILLQHWLFHERVRVTAGDKVYAVNLRGNLGVANLFASWLRRRRIKWSISWRSGGRTPIRR